MKCSVWIFFSLCFLCGCHHSGSEKLRLPSLYNDIAPVPAENFSRAYVGFMASTPEWQKSKDKDVILCGALGTKIFQPGVSVDAAIHRVCKEPFYPSFYHVAVWKPRNAAFYGVRFPPRLATQPSVRTISSQEPLAAGDVIVIFEKAVSF
ncbi:hypothetical protein [Prosthecobacter sp.]|uniref:hypothetical protein n=1 Tax=Prosthecobacter sp. TaxID=1965333 RepID=UPI003782F512